MEVSIEAIAREYIIAKSQENSINIEVVERPGSV
jgi:hypothetical protein